LSADFSTLLVTIAIIAVPIVLAITLHEASHGYVAWKLGDDTAYRLGRVTFNPIKHIDPFGTILLPALMYYVSSAAGAPFLFGFAKPVPVNFRRLRNPRRDMVLVAAAGPGINIALALASGLALHLVPGGSTLIADAFHQMLALSIIANVILAVFNMLPLPPLDGGRVAVGLLPYPLSLYLARLERYGIFILLAAIFLLPWLGHQVGVDLDIIGWVLHPLVNYIEGLVYWITGNNAGAL
jgi:Zn-dependent protease